MLLASEGARLRVTDVDNKLQRIAAGDVSAAAWLYDVFATSLYQRLRRRYGYLGVAEVDDLLQDTFVQALRGRARVLMRWSERQIARPDEAALARYLWDLACGLATNRRRSAARSTLVSIDAAAPLAAAPRAERAVLGRDTLARLAACLKRDNARTYLYYKLRYVDGHTPDEIAQVTGWSRKSTYKRKQLLDLAVKRCAERLDLG